MKKMNDKQMQVVEKDVKYTVSADFIMSVYSDFTISEKDLSKFFKEDYKGYNDCEFHELDRYSKAEVIEEFLEFNDLIYRFDEWSPEDHVLQRVTGFSESH